MTTLGQFASPIDATHYGVYRSRMPGDERPLLRFTGRITADGSSGYPAEADRYHLYAGWFCPWAHRLTISVALLGLDDVISVSYVDGLRDGRGWAFREPTGPDPVNGFTLLREAYDASEPGFDGHVSVPALWDKQTGRVVSNDYRLLGIDLATAFGRWSTPGVDLYPAPRRGEIEDLDRWISPDINLGVARAATSKTAADQLAAALRRLDRHLAERRFLVAQTLTEADIRLWVTLVRYDAGPNAHGRIGPRLTSLPHLWDYARRLYELPAFRDTTEFASFAAPFAALPTWG